ncbi:MAG: flagellin, partial [Candidatus Thorarchaeota archaeon]
MSLRINNNIAAIDAHRNLTLTTRQLSSSMEKLSSGFRINRASDDPAGLVISEQFRAQIAGLGQAIENSEGSINMIQTAEGALNEISNLLISMRELAIHAANEGFNDADQLAADQAEIANAIKTIDRIAANTQFGTKKLLDGTKDNVATITSSNSAGVTILNSELSTGTHSIQATKTSESSATLNTTSLGIALAGTAGAPDNLTEGIHNLDVLQASDGAEKVSGAVDINDAFGNAFEINAVQTAALFTSGGALVAATAGSAGTYNVVLNYQENGEAVTGDQTIQVEIADGDSAAIQMSKWNTALGNNTALAGKVEAVLGGGGELVFQTTNMGTQYSLKMTSFTGTDTTTLFGDFTTGIDRGASNGVLDFTINTASNANVTAAVTIADGSYTSLSALVAAINTALNTSFGTVGTTTQQDLTAEVYDTDKLRFYTADEGSAYTIKMNTVGAESWRLEKALGLSVDTVAQRGTDAIVSFDNYSTSITAVNYVNTTPNLVTLYNKAEGEIGRGSIDLTISTAANGVNLGNLLLDVKAATFDVRLDAGPGTSVTAGKDAVIYNADRTESLKIRVGLTSTGGTETIQNTDSSLVFQIGPNVGQTAKIGIKNLSATALGRNLPGNMFRNLSEIDVTTVQGAQDAQSVIDAVINEVTVLRGTLGSFQKNSLESNLRNLRIAEQNLTASESMIRDTDMAQEMSSFVKDQILLQAGTAMLAQANQVPQVVLSLF